MVEVIPSINVKTFSEVKDGIRLVEPYVTWAHLDVTDGVFSQHLTWNNPQDLLNFETKLKLEVHLMVENPEKIIGQWLIAPIKRVIVHLETIRDADLIIKRCQEAGIEVGLAINPETSWEEFKPWFGKVDILQVLAVSPGPSGQLVQEGIFVKVSGLHKSCQTCIIEIDGGINPATAKKAVDAGVNLLVAGSYIFESIDIKQSIKILRGSTS